MTPEFEAEMRELESVLDGAGERWLEAKAGAGTRADLTRIENETREAEQRLAQLQKEVSP